MISIFEFDKCMCISHVGWPTLSSTKIVKDVFNSHVFWQSYSFIVTNRSYKDRKLIQQWLVRNCLRGYTHRIVPEKVSALKNNLTYKVIYLIFKDDWEDHIRQKLNIKNISETVYKTYMARYITSLEIFSRQVNLYDGKVNVVNAYLMLAKEMHKNPMESPEVVVYHTPRSSNSGIDINRVSEPISTKKLLKQPLESAAKSVIVKDLKREILTRMPNIIKSWETSRQASRRIYERDEYLNTICHFLAADIFAKRTTYESAVKFILEDLKIYDYQVMRQTNLA